MRRLLQRDLSAAMVTCGLLFAGLVLAGGFGMPWEGPLQQIVESITGPVVQAVLQSCSVSRDEGRVGT